MFKKWPKKKIPQIFKNNFISNLANLFYGGSSRDKKAYVLSLKKGFG